MAKTNFSVKLTGMKELKFALNELPARLQKGVIDRTLLKAAEPMHAEAQALAERATNGTGKNARKLIIGKKLSDRQRGGYLKKSKTMRVVYIGVQPSPLAHLIEFGTGPRYTKKGAYRGRMKPSPYMRPAWGHGHAPTLENFGKLLGIEIERAAVRLAKRNAKKAART